MQLRSLGWDDPLEKGMATHSSILAWEIPQSDETEGYSPRRPSLEIFSQGLLPRSWGGPRGPNSQGKAKPHGQVYAL